MAILCVRSRVYNVQTLPKDLSTHIIAVFIRLNWHKCAQQMRSVQCRLFRSRALVSVCVYCVCVFFVVVAVECVFHRANIISTRRHVCMCLLAGWVASSSVPCRGCCLPPLQCLQLIYSWLVRVGTKARHQRVMCVCEHVVCECVRGPANLMGVCLCVCVVWMSTVIHPCVRPAHGHTWWAAMRTPALFRWRFEERVQVTSNAHAWSEMVVHTVYLQ